MNDSERKAWDARVEKSMRESRNIMAEYGDPTKHHKSGAVRLLVDTSRWGNDKCSICSTKGRYHPQSTSVSRALTRRGLPYNDKGNTGFCKYHGDFLNGMKYDEAGSFIRATARRNGIALNKWRDVAKCNKDDQK